MPAVNPAPKRYSSVKRAMVEKIIQKLKKANVTDAKHYFPNPFREIAEDEVPCMKVAIMEDEAEWFTNKPEYKRTGQLVLAYVTDGNDELADQLYHFAERIENFMINEDNTTQFDGMVDELMLKKSSISMENGQIALGAAVVVFDLVYYSQHLAPLDDLNTMNVQIKSGAAASADEPLYEETITLNPL